MRLSEFKSRHPDIVDTPEFRRSMYTALSQQLDKLEAAGYSLPYFSLDDIVVITPIATAATAIPAIPTCLFLYLNDQKLFEIDNDVDPPMLFVNAPLPPSSAHDLLPPGIAIATNVLPFFIPANAARRSLRTILPRTKY